MNVARRRGLLIVAADRRVNEGADFSRIDSRRREKFRARANALISRKFAAFPEPAFHDSRHMFNSSVGKLEAIVKGREARFKLFRRHDLRG